MFFYQQIIARQGDATEAVAGTGMVFGLMCCYFLIIVGIYVYYSMALMTIAKKLGAEDKYWWAWIPILNVLLMLELAGKEFWWLFLLFIPFVNVVVSVIVWMAIAEARGKPSWWGIMLIVPVMNFIAPGYIAWSD